MLRPPLPVVFRFSPSFFVDCALLSSESSWLDSRSLGPGCGSSPSSNSTRRASFQHTRLPFLLTLRTGLGNPSSDSCFCAKFLSTYFGNTALPLFCRVFLRVARASSWASVRWRKTNSVPLARRSDKVLRMAVVVVRGGTRTLVLRRVTGLDCCCSSPACSLSLLAISLRSGLPAGSSAFFGDGMRTFCGDGLGELASSSPKARRDRGVGRSGTSSSLVTFSSTFSWTAIAALAARFARALVKKLLSNSASSPSSELCRADRTRVDSCSTLVIS